jgi:ribosomal protein S24E
VDAEQWQELLGELYGRDHLTYEKIEDLELTVVTEKGETVSPEELRGKIFRVVDRDEPSGYVVKNMETTGEGTTLCYLQASSS